MANEAHNDALDGLRGIAILSVIMLHGDLFGFGWTGVQLFFVISGYLITKNLLKNKRHRLGPYLADFYYRRVLRIFPVYFAYVVFLALLYFIASEPEELGRTWPYLLTFSFNLTALRADFVSSPWFSHFWSLCVEEQFYFVWPLCVYLLSPRGLRAVVVLTIVLAPVVRAFTARALLGTIPAPDVGHAIYWFTPAQADSLAIGAAIAVFGLERKVERPFRLLAASVAVAVALGAANLAWFAHDGRALTWRDWLTFGYPRTTLEHGVHVWSYSVLGLTFGLAVLGALCEPRKSFLAHPGLVWVGKVSYAAYVLHSGVILVMRRVLANAGWFSRTAAQNLVVALVAVPATLLLAGASYRGFEQKFLARRGRYTPRETAPATAPEALP